MQLSSNDLRACGRFFFFASVAVLYLYSDNLFEFEISIKIVAALKLLYQSISFLHNKFPCIHKLSNSENITKYIEKYSLSVINLCIESVFKTL